jgi:hypothetical protein
MKALIRVLKKKLLIWVGVSVLVVPLIYVQYFFEADKQLCGHPSIPPRINSNGTVDYVIIHKCKGYKGRYLVIRLPADQAVSLSENAESPNVAVLDGPSLKLLSSNNQFLVTLYDISKGWKPVSNLEYEKLDRSVVAKITFTEWDNDLIRRSLDRDAKNAGIACETPIEHANGMLEYRAKSGRDPKTYPRCFGTWLSLYNARTYVSSKPIAIFDCWSPRADGSVTGDCKGGVSTKENIYVNVEFQNNSEPTAEQVADVMANVQQQVSRVFMMAGELQTDKTFDFEKIRGN